MSHAAQITTEFRSQKSERTTPSRGVGSGDLFGLFDVINVCNDHLLRSVIDPIIENEVIAHRLENLPVARIGRTNIRHEKWIGCQFVNSIQNPSLSPLGLAGEKIDRC
jgi:hypothetical protein